MKNSAVLANIALTMSLIVAFIGLAVIFGWVFDSPLLKSFLPYQTTMKLNTAIGLLILGSTVSYLSRKTDRSTVSYLGSGVGLIIFFLALLTLVQYLFRTNFGIDEAIIQDKTNILNTGRMSPTTAFCFLSISIATILFAQPINLRFRKIIILTLSSTVMIITSVVFFSYIPNILLSYQIMTSASMGVHTAFAFMLLAASLFTLVCSEGRFTWVLSPWTACIYFFGLASILLITDTYHNFTNQIKRNDEIIMQTQQMLRDLEDSSLVWGAFARSENTVINKLKANIDELFISHTHQQNIGFYQKFLISPLNIYFLIALVAMGAFLQNAGAQERKKIDAMRLKLAAIVDSSDDGIISKDMKGIVTSWNLGAEHIFGYTANEMLAKPISILFPPDRLNEELYILRRIANGEKIEHFETIRKRKDGKLINVSVTISPLKNAKGEIIGASKIVRDVTESKRLESQLRQSQKMGAIGQLSGGIAHDFNNLLGIIIGNLDLLEESLIENQEANKRIQTALKAAIRGSDLTKRLLAFSRQQQLTPKPADLNLSVTNLVEMATQILGSNIKITTDLDLLLPPVLVDVAELESALLNLVVNARDAMTGSDGGKIIISTQLRDLDEKYPSVVTKEIPAGIYAAISVTDTGQGMPPEVLERVYEPFFTTKEQGKGTGMGLSMVYGFAKQSGGIVKIYSEVNHGTTVTIYLPLAQELSSSQQAKAQPVQSFRGETVLVVDDEPDLLEIAATYLKEMGYEVYQAMDGNSAISTLEQHPEIDLLITDIVMPGGMNGVELAKKIRQMKPTILIIYASGFPLGRLKENPVTKFDGPFLRKPYQRTEFVKVIKSIMSNKDPIKEYSDDN